MAVPNFLKGSYYHTTAEGVTDYDAALDSIYTALSGQSPAWTLTDGRGDTPPTVLAKCPTDSDGRFFDILFTVVTGSSNLKMEYRVRDKDANTVGTRRTGAAATGSWTLEIFSGEKHFAMDIYYISATPEFMWATLTECEPYGNDLIAPHVFFNSSKTSADSLSAQTLEYAVAIDNVTSTSAQRGEIGQHGVSSREGGMTPGGYRRYWERQLWARPVGETTYNMWCGRAYHCIIAQSVSTGGWTPRSRVTVPIDVGTTGLFQMSCQDSYDNKRALYRIG